MATHSKIEITAETLDFGSRIVAVRHVVAASYLRDRPLMLPGLLLITLGLLAVGYDFALGRGLSALSRGGSTVTWLALIVVGLGVFSLIYQRRRLVIGLADGSKVKLPAGREDFTTSVIMRVGEAMRAGAGAPLHYRIDLRAETVEILADSAPVGRLAHQALHAPAQSSAHHRGPLHNGQQQPAFANGPPAGRAETVAANGLSHAMPSPGADWGRGAQSLQHHGAANGHDPRNGAGTHWSPEPPSGLPAHQQAPSPAFGAAPGAAYVNGAAAGNGIVASLPSRTAGAPAGRMAQALPANPKRELDALLAFVVRSDIQHKAALIDLLNVVDDHLQGGGTSRTDAVAHWQSFASYVDQYLSGVDGLMPLTNRVGRNFARV